MIDDNDTPTPPPAPKGRIQFAGAHLKHEVKRGVEVEVNKTHRMRKDQHGRLVVVIESDGRLPGAPTGRPPAIPADTKRRMQDALLRAITWYREEHGTLPGRKKIMAAARDAAGQVGADVSPDTLKKRVIEPVLKKLGK
jgi:hypothetical protein